MAGKRRNGRKVAQSILTVVGIFAVWAWWYNGHGTASWSNVFNPVYWWNRYHNTDLYHADGRVLLHGNYQLPEIALTFDDGPHVESRARILDILKQNGIHAAFFDVGLRMAQQPDLVRRTIAEGHIIGNHTYNHYRLIYLPAEKLHREINDTDITFFRITGRHLALLRPPGMRYDARVLNETRQLGYTLVGYSALSNDFDRDESSEYIADRTEQRTENGGILLLHDYKGTAQALPALIRNLRAQGYRFVTIPEMIAHLPAASRPPDAQNLDAMPLPESSGQAAVQPENSTKKALPGTSGQKIAVRQVGDG